MRGAGIPPRGRCGRADLLRALVAGGEELADALPGLIGYARAEPVRISGSFPSPLGSVTGFVVAGDQAPTDPPAVAPVALKPATFWLATESIARGDRPSTPSPSLPPAEGPPRWSERPDGPPALHPLAAWPDLRRRLRPRLADPRECPEPDLERIVARLARGFDLDRLPRRRRPRLAGCVQLVFDRSERLVPYWSDQDRVAGELRRLLPAGSLERAVVHEGLGLPRLLDHGHPAWRAPPPGGLVLVLGDLGSLASWDCLAPWLELGRRLAAAGCRAAALVPCRPERVPKCLHRLWRVIPWERPPAIAETVRGAANAPRAGTEEGVGRLLALLSPALRIEPGLLRAMRLALGGGTWDAGLECELWQHPALASTHSEAATLAQERRAELLAGLRQESAERRRRALALIRTWRQPLADEIWFEEVLNLDPDLQADLREPRDLEDARRFFARVCTELTAEPAETSPVTAWVRRVSRRADALRRDRAVGKSLLALEWRLYRDRPGYRPSEIVDPAELPAPEAQVMAVQVLQRGDALSFVLADGPALPDFRSPLARLETRNSLIRMDLADQLAERDPAFWEDGQPPSWADDWGWDGFGAWVEFSVDGPSGGRVVQRMRWIPPGRFLMGSPEDEPGRWGAEGPRHPVTLAEGFWLFDTPCTQALWEAAMGGNPSRFRSPDRPVEQVSWEDAQGFVERMNGAVPGLELALPTEAQWEYACRAGTDTALYSGPIEILGQHNAPVLDPIAWYGGNSGEGFELENGYDSSGWQEKQYASSPSGTHPVGRKDPNPWGLYDMLGNV